MSRYLSLVFLYNRASHRKIIFFAGCIPLCFTAIFLLKIGNPYEASSSMLVERAFDGAGTILIFIAVNFLALLAVANSLNGVKSAKASFSTTGYTIRRLQQSPATSYITIIIYHFAILIILWAVASASLYAIGGIGLTMSGCKDMETKLVLGILRTEIGHALIPIADPIIMIFNVVAVLALSVLGAKSCYLSWHNGAPSAGVLLVIVAMFLTWTNIIENFYVLLAMTLIAFYAIFSLGDVVSREKHPKGDPFKVNKYEGIMDLDSIEYDDSIHDFSNSHIENNESSLDNMKKYGRSIGNGEKKRLGRLNILQLRRRFLPLGINLEKVNGLFGGCIAVGMAEHLMFFFKYRMRLSEIEGSIKGITIDSGMKMPYFWDLQAHTYYGYLAAILLVLFLQAYWNYEYYNKKTKSFYVMKRLPNKKEYSRTIWISPIIEALFIVLIMILHTAFDLLVYALSTPGIALHSDYLLHILPF